MPLTRSTWWRAVCSEAVSAGRGIDYQYVSASPSINVLSYHDYYGTAALGGDQWNGLAVRFAQMAALGKPIIAGESGLMAGTAAGCMSNAARNLD